MIVERDLSEAELHAMLCFCHHGATMSADVAAMRVRAAAVQAGGVRPPAMVIGGLVSLLTGICALSI